MRIEVILSLCDEVNAPPIGSRSLPHERDVDRAGRAGQALRPLSMGREMADSDSQPLVLVADDDGVTRAMVSAWLRRLRLRGRCARDGDEALVVATEQQPDLLLVDVTMPGHDGFAVCRAVQTASPCRRR